LLRTAALLVLAQASPSPPASPPPASDVSLLELRSDGAALRASRPERITDWKGYDNQPAFSPDSRAVYYTSIREDRQADIYRYDVASRATTRVTSTPEAEYSPTPTPDGTGLSVVRVERDGTQRLWRFPLAGGEPRLLLADVKPVGYHAWLDSDTLALFVLGSPPTLRLASLETGEAPALTQGIGRSLHRIPGTRDPSFLDKSGSVWAIRRWNVRAGRAETIVDALDGSEDYAFMPDGRLLMAQGGRLFSYAPGRDASWRSAGDLEPQGVRRITRLAVSPDGRRLALVADPPRE
jgi:hypothetical protein